MAERKIGGQWDEQSAPKWALDRAYAFLEEHPILNTEGLARLLRDVAVERRFVDLDAQTDIVLSRMRRGSRAK